MVENVRPQAYPFNNDERTTREFSARYPRQGGGRTSRHHDWRHTFWFGMMSALTSGLLRHLPGQPLLLQRAMGHALTRQYHQSGSIVSSLRRFIPELSTVALIAATAAFMLGGLVASIAAEVSGPQTIAVDAKALADGHRPSRAYDTLSDLPL